MRINLQRRVFGSLLAACLLLGSAAVAAPPPGKGNDKGDGGGDGGVTTPFDYQFTIVPIEGMLSFNGVNDYGEAILSIVTADVSSLSLQTDAVHSAGLIDINTGEVTYIDSVLTAATPWTNRPEGFSESIFLPNDINNHGDIVGTSVLTYASDPNQTYREAFLLIRESDGYRPVSLGSGIAYEINDVGDIAMVELDYGQQSWQSAAYVLKRSTGERIVLSSVEPGDETGYLEFDGLNVLGDIVGAATGGGHTPFYWTTGDGFVYPEGLIEVYDINEWGIAAGSSPTYYEYKQRGKTYIGEKRMPTLWTPENGLQVFEIEGVSGTIACAVNEQLSAGESCVAAAVYHSGVSNLWLRVPGHAGFIMTDALSEADAALFTDYKDLNSALRLGITTPVDASGAIDHTTPPTLVGRALRDSDGDLPGIWLLRPVTQ